MPAIYQSDLAKKILPAPIGDDGALITVRGLVIPTALLALNDVMEAVILPAGHVPVDLVLDCDDLDTNGTPTITFDVGLMSGVAGANDSSRTVGNEFFAGATQPQTGFGTIARMTKGNMLRWLPYDTDKGIGVKVAAGPATGVAPLTNLNVNRGSWQPATVYTANDFVTLPNGVRMKCTTGGTSGATNPFSGTIIAAYNTTTTDNTVTWTTADFVIGVTLEYRPHYRYA